MARAKQGHGLLPAPRADRHAARSQPPTTPPTPPLSAQMGRNWSAGQHEMEPAPSPHLQESMSIPEELRRYAVSPVLFQMCQPLPQ